MIVIPPNTALTRMLLPCGPGRLTAIVARLALALAIVFGAPTAASAAGGGVALGGTTKAKAADADETEAAPRPRSVSKNQVRRAQTLLRVSPTGSNDPKTRKVVKRFQELRGIATHGVIDLPTYLQIKDAFALLETGGVGVDIATDDDTTGGTAPTATTPAPELTLPPNLAPITPQEREILDRIAQCESKGDPTVVSSNGLYRGKYQFDRSTWKSVGGSGDPAAATELEQDQRAAILLRQKGTTSWPVCGAGNA